MRSSRSSAAAVRTAAETAVEAAGYTSCIPSPQAAAAQAVPEGASAEEEEAAAAKQPAASEAQAGLPAAAALPD